MDNYIGARRLSDDDQATQLVKLLSEIRDQLKRIGQPAPLQGPAKVAADKFAEIFTNLGGSRSATDSSKVSDQRRENV